MFRVLVVLLSVSLPLFAARHFQEDGSTSRPLSPKKKAGAPLHEIKVPFSSDGFFQCNENQILISGHGQFYRYDLKKRSGEVVKFEHGVRSVSNDGRFIWTGDNKLFDVSGPAPLEIKGLKELKPLPKPYSRSTDPPGGFAEGGALIAVPVENFDGKGLWQVFDPVKAEEVKMIRVRGQIKNFSPDYKFGAYIDKERRTWVENFETGERTVVAKETEDISVTFRGDQGFIVDWRQEGAAEAKKLLLVDLTDLSKPIRDSRETAEFDAKKEAFNAKVKARGGGTGMGRTIRNDPYSEMFEAYGNSGLGLYEGELFDSATGLTRPVRKLKGEEWDYHRGDCGFLEAYYDYDSATIRLFAKSTLVTDPNKIEENGNEEAIAKLLVSKDPAEFLRGFEAMRVNLPDPGGFLARQKKSLDRSSALRGQSPEKLVSDLGHDHYHVRQNASMVLKEAISQRDLVEQQKELRTLLEKAVQQEMKKKSDRNLEKAIRAQQILRYEGSTGSPLKALRISQAEKLLQQVGR